jgi:hypothetical protein
MSATDGAADRRFTCDRSRDDRARAKTCMQDQAVVSIQASLFCQLWMSPHAGQVNM